MAIDFSIITPTFNRGYVLWKTIQGVQRQIFPYWEHLIIDDGSTDNTEQVVAEFQKDPRIKFIKTKHLGGQNARNRGLELAKGKIITYIDSDDYAYENFLSTAFEFFNKNPEKIFAIPNYNRRLELFDESYQLVDFAKSSSSQKDEITLQDLYHWKVKTCGTGIFHRNVVIKDKVRWDPQIKRFQDWDFLLEMGRRYSDGFIHIPFVLFEYLQKYGGDSICSSASYLDWAKGFKAIYLKHKNDTLMKGQTWYPQKIEKYLKLHKEFLLGKIPPANLKDFPQKFHLR